MTLTEWVTLALAVGTTVLPLLAIGCAHLMMRTRRTRWSARRIEATAIAARRVARLRWEARRDLMWAGAMRRLAAEQEDGPPAPRVSSVAYMPASQQLVSIPGGRGDWAAAMACSAANN